jgi:hypothetical protein|tara:strand:- start:22 stop:405 length:384 start_codon:yes stop_codon:yes gene_type:complete
MNNIQKRFLLFLFGCISVRYLFVIIAQKINKKYLPYLGFLALIPASGFLYIYFKGYRKKGGETFGQKIWWNHLRPVHALLYLIFAYLAINKNKNSYMPLLLDVILGLVSFLLYHYKSNNFKKLLYYF